MLLCYAVVGACFSLFMCGEGTRVNDNCCNACSFGIVYRVLCATSFTIEHCDNSCAAVNHPNVPRLIAATALYLADGTHNISVFEHSFISPLPYIAHALFKAGMRHCAYQMDCRIRSPVLEDKLCCNDIHAPSNATDESV